MEDETEDSLIETPDRPSKSEQKRRMHALQELGAALVPLPESELRRLGLPDRLLEAVLAAKTISARGGRKRQLQYIGKLMRQLDPEPIRAALTARALAARRERFQLHELEDLRDRLLEEGDAALAAVLARFPEADRQQLRQLLRAARQERQRGAPPRAARELFRHLRLLQREAEAGPD
jgi:ribosome-associated protein